VEKTVSIDLNAPLNLAFVDKHDPQGRFIKNSAVLSEAGLHNAFEERGEGQWLGDFDVDEIRATLPVTRVLEFNKRFDIRRGRLVWLSPALTATWPDSANDPVRLSDGREAAIPEPLRRLDWKATSGTGNQYMVAVRWGGGRLYVHIFHIDVAGTPAFSQVEIYPSTSVNLATAPATSFRMVQGEMGTTTLQQYCSSLGMIECFPVVFGHLESDEGGEHLEIVFYGSGDQDGDFPNLPNVGAIVDGSLFDRDGQWLVTFVGEPISTKDPDAEPPGPDRDPDRKYERMVHFVQSGTLSEDVERFLHVGIDVGSYSMNSCAIIKIDSGNAFVLERVVKGFWMPDLSGNVRGFPFPESHVTLERGYSPALRNNTGALIRVDPETIRADTHRGVVFNNGLLHHLPDTARAGDLADTQTRNRLVTAWSAERLEYMPVRTCENFNGTYSNPPEVLGRTRGITALFHGFSFVRNSLRLTINADAMEIPHFGGFYCVPTRTIPEARLSPYGIGQYSMSGIFEARHISLSSAGATDSFWASTESWPGSLGRRQGAEFRMRHYRSIGHFTQERSIRNRRWSILQSSNVLQRTDRGGNDARNAYFRAVGAGTAIIEHFSQQQHGVTWRNHTQRITVTVTPAEITQSTAGEARLTLDCGSLVLNYPAKEGIPIRHSSYGITGWTPPESGQLHHGTFELSEESHFDESAANVLYGGDTIIPPSSPTALSQETQQSPRSLGIFDAWIFGIEGIDVYVTTAAGEALWTSVNDTKVATGAPLQCVLYEDAVLLVFDRFTVYAHSTNGNGGMVPEIKILTQQMAVISQTGENLVEKQRGRNLEPLVYHAFSGLGYKTNVAGPNHAPGTDEIQSNFQDILIENRHGNVTPPNSLSLPDGFTAVTPEYPQPIRHINANTPPNQIMENINAFRYSLPISAERGPNLDEWVMVMGNNVAAHIIDGRISLSTDILARRSDLSQLVILGQLFEFDEQFITPVNLEMGQRVFGQHVNKFNKVFAGSSSQRAYFFDEISKTVDTFMLDSGFSAGVPHDLIDGVIGAIPLNEFSYTNVRRLNEHGGTREILLHLADTGVFFRDFGNLHVGNARMLVGTGGLLLQYLDNWRLLRNTVLFEHLERVVDKNDGRFHFMPVELQTGYIGEEGLFMVPRFWEVDFYLSAIVRKLYEGREKERVTVKMGTESIHDGRRWSQSAKKFSMAISDFRDGYYTLRYECLAEECSSQSFFLETQDYVHISEITFRYVTRPGGTERK